MELAGYIASLLMGIILGLMGGGGSIMTVPILVYLFRLSPTLATSYSLFIVGLTTLIGSFIYVRRVEINYSVGLLFAIPSIIGVYISRGLILPSLPDTLISYEGFLLSKEVLIMIVFASLMILASYSMLKPKNKTERLKINPKFLSGLTVLQGLIVGLIAGFVGAGGGFLIIPALVLLSGLSMRVAVGTSLMIIALQSLLGFAGDLSRGASVDWIFLITIAGIAIFGIILGASFSHKVKEQKLKKAFGFFILIMGSAILLEQFRHLS